MTKLIVAFLNIAVAPKNFTFVVFFNFLLKRAPILLFSSC